jgi:hypothetical protein
MALALGIIYAHKPWTQIVSNPLSNPRLDFIDDQDASRDKSQDEH